MKLSRGTMRSARRSLPAFELTMIDQMRQLLRIGGPDDQVKTNYYCNPSLVFLEYRTIYSTCLNSGP